MNLLRQFSVAALVVLAAFLGTWSHAANVPTLVRDINQMPIGVGSNATFLGTIGSLTFFAADDGAHGSELWKTDGTAAGTSLVKDINPGSAASNPANFLVVGNVAYFSATTAASGQEIWVTDGTNSGTRLVADIAPGPSSSGAFPAGALGSKVLIYASDSSNSIHLYASDGTPSGTVALAATDQYQGPTPGILVTATNGKAYFEAYADANNETPFVTDGTVAGTHSLGMTSAGGSLAGGGGFTQAGAYVYFGATTADAGQLFRARLADNVIEQVTSNTAPQDFGFGDAQGFIVAAGNLVYFIGSTAGITQVWRSDGTSGGTFPVAPFSGMAGNSPVSPHLTIANNHLFFISASGSPGFTAAFASDGTVAGTINLNDQFNLRPFILGSDGNNAYFGPSPLVRSDGTASGTHVITNLGGLQILSENRTAFSADTHSVYFGVIGDWPGDSTRVSYATFKYDPAADTSVVVARAPNQPGDLFTLSAGRLYFSGADPTTGDEPWVSDGSVAGTMLLDDIAPEPTQAGSNPNNFYAFQGKLYFSANDGIAGTELWKSDGTSSGTTLAADLLPGPLDSQPKMIFAAGNALMLFAYNSQVATQYLWRYDPATNAASNFPSVSTPYTCQTMTPATTAAGISYFAAFGAAVDLWRTDGSVANTVEIPPSSGGYSLLQDCNFVTLSSAVYFLGQDAAGYGLWNSDGTVTGTTKLVSLGIPLTAPTPRFLTSYAGQLYFLAADTNNQLALYRSDGTSSHTSIVAAAPASLDALLGTINGRLLFGSLGYVGNVGLWAFDPKATAFSSISGVRYLSLGTVAQNGALVFFNGSNTSRGSGPWVTDGTTAGTKPLTDAGGNYPSPVQWLGDFHSTAIYTDTDPNSGVGRYWKSDGTVAGTAIIATMTSGQHVSSGNLGGVAVGNEFYFAVFDPTIGSELWSLKQDAIATATTLTVSPMPAAAGMPVLLKATVLPTSGNAIPKGSINFMDGSSTLGTVAMDQTGSATLTTSTLPVGQHALAAAYSGDSLNSASISPAVNLGIITDPSVSLSISPTAITLGQSATLTWSSANATLCTASNGWTGSQSTSGSMTVTPATAGTLSYVLTCTNAAASANTTATLAVTSTAASSSSGRGGGGGMFFPELVFLGILAICGRFRERLLLHARQMFS